MKSKRYNIKPRKSRDRRRPLVGMIFLEDNRPSKETVSIIASNLLEVVDSKNRAIVEAAAKSVLEKTPV